MTAPKPAVPARRHDRRRPFDLVITPESAGWGYSSLRVLTLAPGQAVEFATGRDEMIVLPLTGGVEVTIGDTTFALAGRESVFTAVTDTAYLPIDSTVTADAAPRGGTIALPGARADRALPFRFQPASEVDVSLRGTGSHTRQVNNFGMGAGMECVKMLATEVLTPASNWSSYPPHKHDEDARAARPSWRRSTTTGSPPRPRSDNRRATAPKPLAINGSTAPRSGRSRCWKRSPTATPC